MRAAHCEIVFAERRRDVRIIVNIAGRLQVSTRRAAGVRARSSPAGR